MQTQEIKEDTAEGIESHDPVEITRNRTKDTNTVEDQDHYELREDTND